MKLRYFNIIVIVLSVCVLVSCTSTTVIRVPTVHSRGSLITNSNTLFYVMGDSAFGVSEIIVENLRSNRYTAEIVVDKRDIPVQQRSSRANQYIITHGYDIVSDEGIWLLDIRIYEFNPRGIDNQVAFGTTTSAAPTRILVSTILARLIN